MLDKGKGMSCLFLEDMIANAFIELNSKNVNIKELSLDLVEKYGNEVSKKLKEQNKRVAFCLSRDATEEIKERYKRYFTFNDKISSVILNDEISVSELIVRFRKYLPLDQLFAYMDDQVVEKGLLEPLSMLEHEGSIQKKLEYR